MVISILCYGFFLAAPFTDPCMKGADTAPCLAVFVATFAAYPHYRLPLYSNKQIANPLIEIISDKKLIASAISFILVS